MDRPPRFVDQFWRGGRWADRVRVNADVTGADVKLWITPLKFELVPGKIIDTYACDGMVPGSVLRLAEGRQVSNGARNDTDINNIIHRHGLYVPSASDGAMRSIRGRAGEDQMR